MLKFEVGDPVTIESHKGEYRVTERRHGTPELNTYKLEPDDLDNLAIARGPLDGWWYEHALTLIIRTPVPANAVVNVLLEDMKETFTNCLNTAIAKNNDYAGKGTLDPFKNFRNSTVVGVDVQRGIMVRMMDKISRTSNLLSQEAAVKGEAITDTLDDLINYAAILKSAIKNNIK